MTPRHGSEMKAGIRGETAPSGAALRLRLAEPPDRNAELLGLVGEVCGNPRAREDHDADRQSFEHLVVALEGCGVAVPVPVGLEDDLWNFAIVGPAGGDALGAARTAAVQEDHVGMLGADLVEGVPDAVDIVSVVAAGEAMRVPAGGWTSVSARRRAERKSRLSMIDAVSARWLTIDRAREHQTDPVVTANSSAAWSRKNSNALRRSMRPMP